MLRREFPNESRLWAVKRIFLGDKLPPTDAADRKRLGTHVEIAPNRQDKPETSDADVPVGDTEISKSAESRLPQKGLSTLTASDVEVDDDSAGDELGRDELNEGSPAYLASGANRLSTLEEIIEVSEA
jgi:hypothetical protein